MMNIFKNENKTKLKILVILFKDCNNNCQFCFQKGFSNIPSKEEFINSPNIVIEQLSKCLENSKKYDEITINLMGGELFFDVSIKQSLNKVLDFIISQKIPIRLTTNLLYKDLQFLIDTYNYVVNSGLNCQMYTSFDFKSRFKDNLNLFYKNLFYLKTQNINFTVEVIRTKKMLESLIINDEESKIFKFITKNFNVCLNELIGYNKELSLSFNESIDLWKLIIEKYKTTDLKSHFSDHGRNCANIQRLMVVDNKIYKGCVPQKFFLQEEEKEKIKYLQDYTKKFNCLNCKYMNVCSLKCPMEVQYNKCDIFEIHEWAREKGIQI